MELPEERYVRETLGRRFGAELRKIPESADQQTADFEMMKGERRVAVLEVKRLERARRTEANGWRPEQGGFLTRKDNATGRVGALVYSAWKQLRHYHEPRVLVFVNDESGIDVHDLEEAFLGVMPYGTEELGYIYNTVSKPIAEGRIREVKGQIDLYIWFDRIYGEGRLVQIFPAGRDPTTEVRTEGPTFRCTSDAGYELARRYFGCPELVRPELPHKS